MKSKPISRKQNTVRKSTVKISLLAAGALILAAAAATASGPGRGVVGRVLSAVGIRRAPRNRQAGTASPTAAATATPGRGPGVGGDIEQRARAAHGWSPSIVNSVITGDVNFFDASGTVTRQGAIKIYREYPDGLRVEITDNGNTDVFGFDHHSAWRAGVRSLAGPDARDARAWLRFAPERLFVTRAVGQAYSESPGPVEETHRPAAPGRSAIEYPDPMIFNRAWVADQIGAAPVLGAGGTAQSPGDQRSIVYYVNSADNIVNSVLWNEPDDPTRLVADKTADFTAMRVDFGAWQKVNGVLWPFEVTVWRGGTVYARVEVSQVQMNAAVSESLFSNPN